MREFINIFIGKHIKTCLCFLLCLSLCLPVSWAGAPAQINYQGKLSNASGTPITNAVQTIRIEIFDQLTGGTSVFGPETHTMGVASGVFNLQIGSIVNGLDTALRNSTDLYLEVTIDPGLPTQAVLAPRQRLVAAPYALAVAANSVGTNEIEDGTITNADINAGAAISAGKLAGVLTAGGTRTDANLNTLTAGPASDADALHTHIGLTAADHAGTHAPGGTDALGSVFISTYTAQTINGLKTFNPDAPGAPFALGPNAAGQLVTGLNADLLNGRNVFDMAVSTRVVSAGTGLTGGGNLTTDRALSLDLSSVNTWTGAQTFGAVTNFPDNGIWNAAGSVGIGTNNPGTYKLNVNGQMNATELCINGSCQSNWPSTGLWTPGAGNEIYYDLAYVGIGTTDPAYDLDVNGAINAQTNLCIGTDCIDSWNAVPPWTVQTGPDRIYYNAGNVGIGPGVVMPSEALEVAGNIAVSGTVDGYDLSAAGPGWDNDLVNDDVDASELTALFSGSAGLLRKIDASTYNTLGSLPGSMIDNDAITSAHLATDSVSSDEIAANAVGSSEISDGSVTSSDIMDETITSADIGVGAVGSNEVATNSLTSSDLAANSVGSSEIVSSAVGPSEIADNAVGNSEMADNAIGSAEIIDGSITSDDLDTTYAAYAFRTISVPGTDPVADSASDTLTLNAGSNITISGGSGDSITISASGGGGTATDLNCAGGCVNATEIEADAVGSSEVIDNSLTSNDLAPDSVGGSELGPNAVGSVNVILNSLTASDLAADSVGASELADNSVGSANVIDNSLTDADIQDNITASLYLPLTAGNGFPLTGQLYVSRATPEIYLRETDQSNKTWHIGTQNSSFRITETGLDYRLTIIPNGNVGIGTTSPGAKLHVSGNAIITERDLAFSAKAVTSQSNGNSSPVKFHFPSEIYDNGNDYDTGSYEYVAPYDGVYQFCASVYINSNDGTSFIYLYLYKNGASEVELAISRGQAGVSGCVNLSLSAGDAITIWGRSLSSSGYSYSPKVFSGHRLY